MIQGKTFRNLTDSEKGHILELVSNYTLSTLFTEPLTSTNSDIDSN